MTPRRRNAASTGDCERCGAPIIDALLITSHSGLVIRLDAAHNPTGAYSAYYNVDRATWLARGDPSSLPSNFQGLRRNLHTCPNYQLTLDEAGRE